MAVQPAGVPMSAASAAVVFTGVADPGPGGLERLGDGRGRLRAEDLCDTLIGPPHDGPLHHDMSQEASAVEVMLLLDQQLQEWARSQIGTHQGASRFAQRYPTAHLGGGFA